MSDAKTELLPDDLTPPELLASRLIDAWCEVKGRPIPWENAVEITAIITRMPNAERQRLLALNAEDTPSAPSSSQQGEADAKAVSRAIAVFEEALTYIGSPSWSPSMLSEAEQALAGLRRLASLESAKSGEVGK